MKKVIISVLAIAGVCCYLDKTDKSLNDITSNDNVKSTFESMKKVGNIINNSEVYNNVKDTAITFIDDIKTNPKVKEITDNTVDAVTEFVEKIK